MNIFPTKEMVDEFYCRLSDGSIPPYQAKEHPVSDRIVYIEPLIFPSIFGNKLPKSPPESDSSGDSDVPK